MPKTFEKIRKFFLAIFVLEKIQENPKLSFEYICPEFFFKSGLLCLCLQKIEKNIQKKNPDFFGIFLKKMDVTIVLSRYHFNGLFVNGKMNGNGILTLSPQKTIIQQRCIIIKSSLFDLPTPDTIEGEFRDGFVFGIANLTWSGLNIKMSAHLQYGGVLHGMFKVHDNNRNIWIISNAVRNKMTTSSSCWIVSPDHVSCVHKLSQLSLKIVINSMSEN